MNNTIWAAALLCPVLAWAHGGGLNAEGCHTNRKTGDYHCHRGNSAAAAPPAAAVPQHAAARPQPQPGARPTCHTGPRGGTYTITSTGRKNYSGC